MTTQLTPEEIKKYSKGIKLLVKLLRKYNVILFGDRGMGVAYRKLLLDYGIKHAKPTKGQREFYAQLSQDCPVCKGERLVKSFTASGTYSGTIDCPTCQGTGKADSPELEKIAWIFFPEYTDWDTAIKKAHQIIALCEEAIRKDERKRIGNFIKKNGFNNTDVDMLISGQALKEKE